MPRPPKGKQQRPLNDKIMKKFLVLTVTFALSLAAGLQDASAQATINTKKVRISDFTTKTTKVVLSGSEMFNLSLKDEVSRRWRVTPFEFCTPEEFESIKTNQNYYFLMPVDSRLKKETAPGVSELRLFKGGTEGGKNPQTDVVEVVSVPYGPSDYPTGREFTFLPAILDVIQCYAMDATASDRVAYGTLTGYATNIMKASGKTVYISSDDLTAAAAATQGLQEKGVLIKDEDEVDNVFASETADALVGYVVAPTNPEKNSVCYKMIFAADTHELFYFEKHTLKGSSDAAGFLPFDLKIISNRKK